MISTANDLAVWIKALAGGHIFSTGYYRLWLDSLNFEEKEGGQRYGYGISEIQFGPNKIYFHGGELPGFNTFIGHDPENQMTLIVWTHLTISLDGRLTANTIMLKVLDHIYAISPLKH